MAVKRCPRCGDLYLAAVDVCVDCGDTLVEVADDTQQPGDATAANPAQVGDHDAWPLDSWTMEGRRLLDGMLDNAGVPRSWQGATLSTPASARGEVEQMVAVVGRGDAQIGDGDSVGYEVSDWTDEALDQLVTLLARDQVPYGWDADGDLEVASEHEAVVDAIFAELAGPDAAGGAVEDASDRPAGDGADDEDGEADVDEADDDVDDDDGLDAHETLSDVFLAADRLARNPLDGAARRSLVEARDRLVGLALPFGFAPKVWTELVARSDALADLVAGEGLDDDAVEQQATAVRDTIRDFV